MSDLTYPQDSREMNGLNYRIYSVDGILIGMTAERIDFGGTK